MKPKNLPELGVPVVDDDRDVVGYVIGAEGPYLQLRPPGGGLAWDADPDHVHPAGDLDHLRARVSELNRQRRP
ncbi:hypothetical protein [Streptomyces sp. NPDC047071]|uniref:hypothetical protein n=1 Tax=Streptomyces sp. NPDC047071 TaxID=3154808 RepID=UPI003453FD16